jgi:hypothetical protein
MPSNRKIAIFLIRKHQRCLMDVPYTIYLRDPAAVGEFKRRIVNYGDSLHCRNVHENLGTVSAFGTEEEIFSLYGVKLRKVEDVTTGFTNKRRYRETKWIPDRTPVAPSGMADLISRITFDPWYEPL